VQHEGRRRDAGQQRGDVDLRRGGEPRPGGRRRRRGAERVGHQPTRVAGVPPEPGLRGGVREQVPVLVHKRQQRLGLRRAHRLAQPRGAAEQHQARDPLRVLGRERDGGGDGVVPAEQPGGADAGRVEDGDEVPQVRVETEVGRVDPAVGATGAAAVVQDERGRAREPPVRVAKRRHPPLRDEVAQRRQPDDRRPRAEDLVGDRDAVGRSRVPQLGQLVDHD
jgi:hypothetical protein